LNVTFSICIVPCRNDACKIVHVVAIMHKENTCGATIQHIAGKSAVWVTLIRTGNE